MESKIMITPYCRSNYVCETLDLHAQNGDAFIGKSSLYNLCRQKNYSLSPEAFQQDLQEQMMLGKISEEEGRFYVTSTLKHENFVSGALHSLFYAPRIPALSLPADMEAGGIHLCHEQVQAVHLALSNRLSVILGGAGCGKSTLIQAIAKFDPSQGKKLFCAPTGKACRNLETRIQHPVYTIHSLFSGNKQTPDASLIVVDEASMLTLEMFAWILENMPGDCRVALVGDPNQLSSIGAGNILPDLIKIGVPHILLCENHRQNKSFHALSHNTNNFSSLKNFNDLCFDPSFQLSELPEHKILQAVTQDAAKMILNGENVQVLTLFNEVSSLSVKVLNESIRDLVNPPTEHKPQMIFGKSIFRDGDRIIITKNDKAHHCCNGDVGTLHIIQSSNTSKPCFCVDFHDGRCPEWDNMYGLQNIALAYAMTIHKAQGSEYDSVLLPITGVFQFALKRNLFYTAITRAKNHVQIYGNQKLIDAALKTQSFPRKSMLPEKLFRLDSTPITHIS